MGHLEASRPPRSFRKKHINISYKQNHKNDRDEKNNSTVVIYEAGDTLATILNLPLSKAEITARLSGFFVPESDETGKDALASYILDDDLRRRVIHACHCCRTLKDIHDRVLFLLKQSPCWDRRIMTSTPFFESLIPHLFNLPRRPTAKQIYQAVYYAS